MASNNPEQIDNDLKSEGQTLLLVDDINATGGYGLTLEIYRFAANAISISDKRDTRTLKLPVKNIIMPIPANLEDSLVADYASGDAGGVFAALEATGIQAGEAAARAKQAYDLVSNSYGAAGGAAAYGLAGYRGMKGSATRLASAVKEKFITTTLGEEGSTFIAKQGSISNPRTVTHFSNMQLKSHSFQWNIVPKSADESIKAMNVIRHLQYHMAPELTPRGARFNFPELFQIKFVPKQLAAYLYQPNVCILQNLQVSYNSETGPAFFAGTKAPVQMSLTLTFGEVVVETKGTIEQKYNDAIRAISENLANGGV